MTSRWAAYAISISCCVVIPAYLCGTDFRARIEIAADRAARVARCGAKASSGIVAGTLAPDCFRDVAPALIEWRS